MFFDDSRPDRKKRANKLNGVNRAAELANSPIPPARSYELLTPAELFSGGDRTLLFDVESYKSYFLVSFMDLDSEKVIFFEDSPDETINTHLLTFIFHRFLVVGFNSRTYDLPICMVAMQGAGYAKLKDISDEIIKNDMQAYEVERKYKVKAPHVNHIDLIEVAPITASLKIYAGRLHCERMQDLPYPEDMWLTREQAANVRDYNINDLLNTKLLYQHLKPSIDLREELGKEYKQDLRSKSDAQIAEAVIKSELEKIGVSAYRGNKERYGEQFYYKIPQYISFRTPQFQEALKVIRTTPFEIGNSGAAECPQGISALRPALGSSTYRLGVGGLHSSEESIAYRADAQTLLIDRDVASFYPQIILNQGLYPETLGPAFLEVFRTLVMRRLTAKHKAKQCKDAGLLVEAAYWASVSDSLKIVINGTFGKLGNVYSCLYAPELLTQVTVTGQLSLMMLIEMIELVGIPIVSANTDGIVIKCPVDRYADLEAQIIIWEELTGFTTEETRYAGLYSRDVNNYIAVKLDGECKTKGVYSEVGSALNSPLSKNPESYITSLAVQAYISRGVPIEETIRSYGNNEKCKHYPTPISRFVNVRTVKGGAEKDGVFLGKAIRWYYASDERGTINYVLSGNNVPKSYGAKPLMTLGEFPADLDFDHYINEANETLCDIGWFERKKVAKLI